MSGQSPAAVQPRQQEQQQQQQQEENKEQVQHTMQNIINICKGLVSLSDGLADPDASDKLAATLAKIDSILRQTSADDSAQETWHMALHIVDDQKVSYTCRHGPQGIHSLMALNSLSNYKMQTQPAPKPLLLSSHWRGIAQQLFVRGSSSSSSSSSRLGGSCAASHPWHPAKSSVRYA